MFSSCYNHQSVVSHIADVYKPLLAVYQVECFVLLANWQVDKIRYRSRRHKTYVISFSSVPLLRAAYFFPTIRRQTKVERIAECKYGKCVGRLIVGSSPDMLQKVAREYLPTLCNSRQKSKNGIMRYGRVEITDFTLLTSQVKITGRTC